MGQGTAARAGVGGESGVPAARAGVGGPEVIINRFLTVPPAVGARFLNVSWARFLNVS